ncbi:MAG TPA: MCP four helix bundle domain-containing protein, partial [Chitinispirillaceae bacterium]|nr:MCP four helix bundle domain-containing protein [Chitinispirillaceae bacterium]
MSMMTNMSVGKRLTIGFMSIVILMLFTTGISIWSLSTINKIVIKQSKETKRMIAMAAITEKIYGISQNIGALMSKDVAKKNEHMSIIAQLRKEYKEKFDSLSANVEDNDDKEILDNVQASIVDGKAINGEAINAAMSGKETEAFIMYIDKVQPAMKKTFSLMETLTKNKIELISKLEVKSNQLNRAIFTTIIISSLIILLVAMFFGIFIT